MPAGQNCLNCGRALVGPQSFWCIFCVAAHPAAWTAFQNGAPPPGNDADEQARAERAVQIALLDAFWPVTGKSGGLRRA